MSITKFFLSLSAFFLGSTAFLGGISIVTQTTPGILDTEAIADVTLTPRDKGAPDSTMSGTSRSGLYEGFQKFS